MGSFSADLDQLDHLGGVLKQLADEAGGLRTGPAAGPFLSPPGGMMSSVLEASSISADLVDGALVPAIEERLGETGEIMVHTAAEYRNQDESNAEKLATTYTNATGDWSEQP